MKIDEKRIILDYFNGNFRPFFSHYITNLPKEDKRPVLCPFHDDHNPSLSLNYKTGQFYCHACGAKGNIFTFYALKYNLNIKRDFSAILKGIIADFNIPCSNSKRIVQTYDYTDEKGNLLFQVVRYEPKGFAQRRPDGKEEWVWNLNGIKRVLYRLQELIKGSDPVFVVEGEKDADRLIKLGLTATTNPGGSGKWRQEYNPYFQGRDVVILPDNDPPGKDHGQKVANSLVDKVKSVKVLDLPGLPEKGDVSDWLDQGGDKEALLELVQQIPQFPEVELPQPEVSLQDVKDTFHKWLYIEAGEDIVLDVVLASVIANRFEGDPVWLFVVAPPGGMKTEILRALKGCKEIYSTSSLTQNTLISGLKVPKNKSDPSLLPRLNGKVLVIKDFTAILGLHHYVRGEIFSQLRDAYDGEASREFGSGVWSKSYVSKFGLIAAVTPAIDRYYSVEQDLGERFLRLRLTSSDTKERVRRAATNRGKAREMRLELKEAIQGFLLTCKLSKEETIAIPEETLDLIIDLASLLAVLRSTVSRSGLRNERVDFAPVPEIGTRLVGQFTKLGSALAGIRGKTQIEADEFELLRRIASDTLPSKRVRLLETLYHLRSEFLPTGEIGEMTEFPTETCKMALEDFRLLKIVEREGTGTFKWRLTEKISQLMENIRFFSKTYFEGEKS